MYQNKTLIFFGAHPDDESFGVGATLAQYAAKGVKVYYVCSTGGEEGTVEPHFLKGYGSIKELREHELKCAAEALGLAGSTTSATAIPACAARKATNIPNALAMAPVDEVAGRMVKIIRELKPDVVITHDSGGGYGHPDHVATHEGDKKAFFAANDPAQYPAAGPPFQPGKLYFLARSRKLMRVMIKLMPLFGRDPRHFGRNGDVDLTRMTGEEAPIHAIVRLNKQAVEARRKAVASHPSQSTGRETAPAFSD